MEKTIPLKIEGEEIVFADITSRENLEVVVVCKSDNVFLFDCETNTELLLPKLTFPSHKLNLQIYSFQNYVCIVQKNGTDGMVISLSNSNYRKQLERGDYCAHASLFPIAFYSKENQTFLIYGTDWNRLDITCLDTDEILTNRIVDYDNDSNYFDYFHSSLYVSPNSKLFVSSGWVWQPYEVITLYSIEDFLKEFELSHTQIEFVETSGYNWERPMCWIDNKTLAVSYNKREMGEIKGDVPSEIFFIDVLENKIIDRIEFNGFSLNAEGEVSGELYFDFEKERLIALNKKSGLLITDISGKEIIKDENFTSYKYSHIHKNFYRIDRKNQLLEIIEINE